MIKIEGVTHWSIPVNDLEKSEAFYRDLLGLEYKGRLTGGRMACLAVDGNNILLCQRNKPVTGRDVEDAPLHHSFTVDPACFEDACRTLVERGVPIDSLVYREKGFFTGRELYFNDPSGNRLELRDATWVAGMPKPSLQKIVGAKAGAATGA
jgi:catechol 2,3-dioxygenase-like lactoylglutathione lyase family enzyme